MSVGVRGDNLADMTYQWIVLGADEEEIIIEGANTAVYESAPITNQWATCYACKVQDCYGNMGYAFFDIILINDLQELSLDEVVSVTQTIPYSIIAYKYVPAVTGNYQIQLFESNIYCTICDENWNDLASNYQELSYDLQAGKTYYFKVQIGDEATGTVEAKLTMPEEHHMTSEMVSEATCIAEGEIKYTCKDDGCDYTYTDTIPVLPHELVKTEQKEATAEENGNIEYWTCCNCHKYFSDAEGKAEISLEDTITTVAAEPIEISSATVSGISNKTYNGNAQTQTFSISVNDAVLTEGTDYTVSYTNSVNAGTATVTITGIGQYIGTLTKTFTISAKTVTPTVTLAATTYTYDGTAKQPSVTVKDGSTTLAATDYTVAYSNNVNAGTSTATVTLKGNYSGSATASYSIQAKKITPTVTLSKRSFAYNGKEQKPAVTAVKDRTGTLPASVYDITYSGTCKKPGAYKVIVTLKGNYSGTATGNFSIVKAKNPMTVKTANKTVKVATVKKKAVTVKAITVTKAQGKVIYMKASGKFYFTVDKNTGKIKVKKRTPKGTYNVKVIVTAKGNYNYKRLSKTVYVKIVVK